ncbi:ribonuclease P protein subunit RPR2 [Pancytospora philotis]|nr:ribonuclease P protein subunit RPR2 [Pancytospora philotis]
MKKKNQKTVPLHLDYLYMSGANSLYQDQRVGQMKKLLRLAQQTQTGLGKVKKTICAACCSLLIPKVTCSAEFIRRENGFGLEIVCVQCRTVQFTVIRGG